MSPPPPSGPFRLGAIPGATPGKWIDTWKTRMPRNPLELVPLTVAGQRAAFARGDMDAAIVRLPIDRDGLNVIPLYEETTVVVLLPVWYVGMWLAVSKAVQRRAQLPFGFGLEVTCPAFLPIKEYSSSGMPGANWLKQLWWRNIPDQVPDPTSPGLMMVNGNAAKFGPPPR